MSRLTGLNSFAPDTYTDPSPLNDNFTQIATALNGGLGQDNFPDGYRFPVDMAPTEHVNKLASHDSTLTSYGTRLDGHDTDLAAKATTISNHETRITGLESLNITFGLGNHGEYIPVPSGYERSKCKFMVFLAGFNSGGSDAIYSASVTCDAAGLISIAVRTRNDTTNYPALAKAGWVCIAVK